jgi:hypothetical protein
MSRLGIVTTTLLAGVLAAASAAQAQPLRRNLDDYFILAQQRASLKDMMITTAHDVGVNCANLATDNAKCGILRMGAVTFATGSQSASDKTFFTKPGALVYQVFRNDGGPLDHVTIAQPPAASFTPPILPGTCSDACEPDVAALEAVCGFPSPFPACDSGAAVTAVAGRDCAFDTIPGNGQCDLGPGVYGVFRVKDGATASLSPGDYAFCDVKVGKQARVIGRVTITIPNGGVFKANNGTIVGQDCGDVTVLIQGKGKVSFGRNGSIAARVCAPASNVSLGHGNVLQGQFVGNKVVADRSNRGSGCNVAGVCACVDDFSPKVASVGDVITFTQVCNPGAITAVRICGISAPITSQSGAMATVNVPAGAAGSCEIAVDSPAGTFAHAIPLVVS